MKLINCFINNVYNRLEAVWDGPMGHRFASSILVFCFIVAMCLVEMKRFILVPESIGRFIPKNHLTAIEVCLTLLLIIEVMGLVFSIVKSVTTSVGKQLEILSIILLRDVFKEISHFSEPLVWSNFSENLISLAATSFGALFIFGVLCLFYMIKREEALKGDEEDKRNFILSKKLVSLALLVCFHVILLENVYVYITGGVMSDPFESFYTLLIISDILIVFISMRYGHDYPIAFRNSAFAVVTVFIRVSLISPPIYSALTGVGASLFALGTLYAYSVFVRRNLEMSKVPLP